MQTKKRGLRDAVDSPVSHSTSKKRRLCASRTSDDFDAPELVRRCWDHLSRRKCCKFWVLRTDVPGIEYRRGQHIQEPRQKSSGPPCEAKLNPCLFRKSIDKISKILSMPRAMPTIDCFATRRNAQQTTGCMFINRAQNFFSSMWYCETFWSLNIAWAHPPSGHGLLHQTIDAFAERGMRGYICGHMRGKKQHYEKEEQNAWLEYARAQSGYRAEVNLGGCGKNGVYLSLTYGYHSDGGQKCSVDVVVVYFDFRRDEMKE